MEINEEPQYSIKWHKTTPLLLAIELQVPDNQTVMERMKLSTISGKNPTMKEKTLLKANTQKKEVLQGVGPPGRGPPDGGPPNDDDDNDNKPDDDDDDEDDKGPLPWQPPIRPAGRPSTGRQPTGHQP